MLDAPASTAAMRATAALPAPAWPGLAAVAGGTSILLLAFIGRYGYHRDELYYRVAGRHLAWGYDDQPPLVPALARLTDGLSNGSLVALRLPVVLVVSATVLLIGLLTRELGGKRSAQVLAALGWATAPVVLISGHLLSTTPFDLLCWALIAWLVARWARTRDDRLLLALGPVIGVGLLAKSLPLIFLVALAGAIAISGPRQILRRPALWVAAAIALTLWAPNLWWQASHGWPQLEMTAVIRADADFGGRAGLLPAQLLMVGPPLAVISAIGLWRLLRAPEVRPYRFLGVAFLILLFLVLLTGGRAYYPAGAFPALVSSGAIAAVGWFGQTRDRFRFLATALAVNGLVTVAIALPIYPVRWLPNTPQAAVNYDAVETVGWPELANNVASVYRSLPAAEQATAVILTGNYGQAGAIDRYGRALGLPAPYSGHVNFWRWGPPPDSATGPVIVIGDWSAETLASYCESVTLATRHDNGYGLTNEEQGVPVWLCRDLRRPWSQIWPELRHLS
ncbi:MAG TPA: glycosyltransferase family 39 protein [Micromonospora sp.]|nr:glycosyltransferase family 39 protein [Micromonospora sp.]